MQLYLNELLHLASPRQSFWKISCDALQKRMKNVYKIHVEYSIDIGGITQILAYWGYLSVLEMD